MFILLGCNEVFSRAAGLESPDQIVGKTDSDLPWPREEAEAYRADDQEVMTLNQAKRHIMTSSSKPTEPDCGSTPQRFLLPKGMVQFMRFWESTTTLQSKKK